MHCRRVTSPLTPCLASKFRWVDKAYHFTHTACSRGVSVLIHGSLDYQELDSVVDTEGRYVTLHCRLFSLKCILAFVYIPPPYSHQVLRAMLEFQLGHRNAMYVVGYFNCYMDPHLDKHPSVASGRSVCRTALRKLVKEVGWLEVWRSRNPGKCQFSCFSKSQMSLSHIDLCLCLIQLSGGRDKLCAKGDIRSLSTDSWSVTP